MATALYPIPVVAGWSVCDDDVMRLSSRPLAPSASSARASHRATRGTLVVGTVLVHAVVACTPAAAPTIVPHTLIAPLEGACPSDASAAAGEFEAEITSYTAQISADDIAAPIEGSGTDAITLESIPAGEGRTVALFGMSEEFPTWRGVARNVTVTAGKDTAVDVLMARIADFTCARTSTGDARAFHTATLLDDGTVLVAGGMKSDTDASATCGAGCRALDATASAAIYDPHTGVFTPVEGLASPRMFHTAAKLADGRVVIAGGTLNAQLHPVDANDYPFPIVPTGPLAPIEVYDPSTRSFESGGVDPAGARVFAAATTTLDGAVLITGGVPGAGVPRNDLGNALSSTTVCEGKPLSCTAGPPMAKKRAGHMAFTIDPEGMFVWGGSVDVTPVGNVDGYQLEVLQEPFTAFALLPVANMNAARNVFFAAHAQYVGFRVLAAGGLVRSATGEFELASVDIGTDTRGPVYVFDVTSGDSGGIATRASSDAEPMHIQAPRAFAAAAGLPDQARAIVAGGVRDLAMTPSADVELYEQGTPDAPKLALSPLLVLGAPRTMREARGGLTATALGDGTVLLTGGATTGHASLSTAEVFADPQDPPGVPGVLGGAP